MGLVGAIRGNKGLWEAVSCCRVQQWTVTEEVIGGNNFQRGGRKECHCSGGRVNIKLSPGDMNEMKAVNTESVFKIQQIFEG